MEIKKLFTNAFFLFSFLFCRPVDQASATTDIELLSPSTVPMFTHVAFPIVTLKGILSTDIFYLFLTLRLPVAFIEHLSSGPRDISQ